MRPWFRALSVQQTPDSNEDDTKESNNISCNQATDVLNTYIYQGFWAHEFLKQCRNYEIPIERNNFPKKMKKKKEKKENERNVYYKAITYLRWLQDGFNECRFNVLL